MDEVLGFPAAQCHIKRTEHGFGMHVLADRPTHHASAPYVDDGLQVDEPLPSRYAGHAG